jgi:hypothetical protein
MMMAIKDLLQKTADKYKVAITYGENSAEITGFQGKDKFELRYQKVEIRMEIESYLESLKMDYTMTSSFSPEKLTLKWRQK